MTEIEKLEHERLKYGIVQALAERERIIGIIDDYNVGGQFDWLIEKIKNI